MTEDAIRDGFARLRPGEELENLGRAAQARALTDWLIGMNATRALTKRLKGRREKGAWSAGRVQTPTLALLVERELEVLAHNAKGYWRLVGTFEFGGQSYTGTWFDPSIDESSGDDVKDDRIFDEARANAIVAATTGRPGQRRRDAQAVARDRAAALRSDQPAARGDPPLRLDRAPHALGRAALLRSPQDPHLSAHRLALPAERLPREGGRGAAHLRRRRSRACDSRATSTRSPSTAPPRSDCSPRDSRTRRAPSTTPRSPTTSRSSRPAACRVDSVSGDDRKIFDLVVRRFLGNFHPPAVWERVERTTVVAGERFRSRARTIMEPGWRSIGDAGTDEEGVSSLPPLIPGSSDAAGVAVATSGVEAVAEQTKPPPRITEARLLSLMENAGKDLEDEDFAAAMHERGLGTPATRAEIIENLIAKGYAVRLGRAIRPTAKGIRLIDILRRVHIDRLTSAELTGEMEYHLNQVEHGQRAAGDFMDEIEAYTREIVERAKTFEYEELYAKDAPLGPCPNCGRPGRRGAVVLSLPGEARARSRLPAADLEGHLGPLHRPLGAATTLIRDGKTGALEGFTARNGRTYQAMLEIDREAWQVKIKPVAWEEGTVSDDPEYEVNTEPRRRAARSKRNATWSSRRPISSASGS